MPELPPLRGFSGVSRNDAGDDILYNANPGCGVIGDEMKEVTGPVITTTSVLVMP